MSGDGTKTDLESKRELLASAAERRLGLGLSPKAEDVSERPLNLGACTSDEIDLSQPLFGM